MMTWTNRNHSVQLFGHSQVGKFSGFDQDLPLHYNQYDVGVDRNNYSPISLQELINNNLFKDVF